MCRLYHLGRSPRELARQFRLTLDVPLPNFAPSWRIARPIPPPCCAATHKPANAAWTLRWGLVPHWTKMPAGDDRNRAFPVRTPVEVPQADPQSPKSVATAREIQSGASPTSFVSWLTSFIRDLNKAIEHLLSSAFSWRLAGAILRCMAMQDRWMAELENMTIDGASALAWAEAGGKQAPRSRQPLRTA